MYKIKPVHECEMQVTGPLKALILLSTLKKKEFSNTEDLAQLACKI